MDGVRTNNFRRYFGGQMTKQHISFLVFFLISSLTATACYQKEEFSDIPNNLEKRKETFENVAQLLGQLPSLDETKARALTQHADKRVRRAAALRLMTLGSATPKTNHALEKLLLHDSDARVRSAAARALGESAQGEAAEALVLGICDTNANVRLFSLKSLIHRDTRANNTILKYLVDNKTTQQHCPTKADTHHTLRQELIVHLEQQGNKFLPLLTQGLRHSNMQVASTCLTLLKKIGRAAAIAIPNIVELLHNSNEDIRLECIQVLAAIGDQHPTVMPSLVEAQSDSSLRIQAAAANAIRKIRAQNSRQQVSPSRANRSPNGRHSRRPPPPSRR